MNQYRVVIISPEEYQKAREDVSYAPKELIVGYVESSSYTSAQLKFRHLVKIGTYSNDASLLDNYNSSENIELKRYLVVQNGIVIGRVDALNYTAAKSKFSCLIRSNIFPNDSTLLDVHELPLSAIISYRSEF